MDSTPHIAVVDDHRDIRDLVGKYLTKHGYRVSIAENAQALRRLLDRSALDLIVLDIMMPARMGCRCAAMCAAPPRSRSSFLPP